MYRQDIKPFQNFTLVKNGMSFATEGCAITACFDAAEQEKGVFFTISRVKTLVKQMYKRGYIDSEFTIQGASGWVGCLAVCGIKVIRLRYEPDPGYKCTKDEREILKLVKPGYAHFVRGNGKGQYSWDSLGIRPAQKDYSIGEKRVFEV